MSWGTSLKRSIIRASTRNSSNAGQMPGHVATLRPYESQANGAGQLSEKTAHRYLESGHKSHERPSRDSASSLVKDDASVSMQSVSVGSW
jgi:hypothetical protein